MIKLNFRTTLTAIGFSAALASTVFFSESSLWAMEVDAKPVFVPSVQQQGFADIVSRVKLAVVSVQVKSNERKKRNGFLVIFLKLRDLINCQINTL